MTTIDIILFCYKQEQYIRQAVESVLMQEYPKDAKVRIIVADDHSPDNTLGISHEVLDSRHTTHYTLHPDVVYLPEEANMGISKNYKRSFKATEGEYVFILEGDDYWLPGHVMQHVGFLEAHKECSMSFNMLRILEDETGKTYDWKQKEEYILADTRMQIEEGNQLGNLSGCCFRGECLRKLPESLFEIRIADWMLGVMMTEMGPIGRLKEVTNVYRVKASGVWAGQSKWQQHKTLISYANMYERYQNKKYHKEWMVFKKSCWKEVRRNWMHYIPAGLRDFIHKFTK